MEQRLSLVTLGVTDLERSHAFYRALGWTDETEPGADVVFYQAGGMIVALWDRAKLADDSGVTDDNGGWGGVTLAHNVRSPEEVDEVIAQARRPGRRSPARGPRRSGAATRACSPTRTATPGRSPTTRSGRSTRTARSRVDGESDCHQRAGGHDGRRPQHARGRRRGRRADRGGRRRARDRRAGRAGHARDRRRGRDGAARLPGCALPPGGERLPADPLSTSRTATRPRPTRTPSRRTRPRIPTGR